MVKKKRRRAVAVGETKIKLENLDAYYFLRKILELCENKPLILVDKGPWYRWKRQRLGLKYTHETFGERNAIEGWYSLFKARVKSWSVAWACLYNMEVLT